MRVTQGCCMLFSTNPGSSTLQNSNYKTTYLSLGGTHGVMVIVVGNGHSDMSLGQDWLHFT